MQHRTLHRLTLIGLLALILGSSAVSSAEHRGYFFGSYQISNVHESGDQIELTMKVVLLNYTGKEIKGCGVLLYDSAPVRSAIGTFNKISSFPPQGPTSLVQTFTVSKAQYASWKQGEHPVMAAMVPEEDGSSRLDPIDLTPAPSPAAPTE